LTTRTKSLKREAREVKVDLDSHLAATGLTLTELANRVGITLVNLSVLRNNRAKAIRFSTLESWCDVLDCQPGDILKYE
jgi:putative transcriptional regulator